MPKSTHTITHKAKSDRKKTSAELEADVRDLRVELDAYVRHMQEQIDKKQALADAARAREEERARLEFNEAFVAAAKGIKAADCVLDGETVYGCVVRHMVDISADLEALDRIEAELDAMAGAADKPPEDPSGDTDGTPCEAAPIWDPFADVPLDDLLADAKAGAVPYRVPLHVEPYAGHAREPAPETEGR
ncbi:hypothetical protein [uncultured Alistipes sp.]|uniref:hypothetical protein n=1 Tax=uncultured Alistipes sp. TaxID=538949 RepID=UPI00272C6B91|nr:hypothetical protein [uncultured Alistipes sp.]